ncbi:iron uptake transporter deferrochelatase/peroxidase subunit [Paraburkholderia sp. C35]|uniref:iron uptake transporter deferrochelatase/peroxidase subunit n=1 Tax=Paraburkholderia sp. C35 TaxID=2126993 RepID=UPI000D68BB98|nr:iron uptake transporter deferrochelatase/peroxidase subunit [Paraburkholderia sp. C35]
MTQCPFDFTAGLPESPRRRRLLAGAGLLGGALVADLANAAAPAAKHVTDAPAAKGGIEDRYPFRGLRQQGITTPRPAAGMVAAFDVLASDRAGLERLFRVLTERIAFLTTGGPVPQTDPDYPPPDSGILGPVVTPDGLTVTVSVGASLFDDRFGLAAQKPVHLTPMTGFPNDSLGERLCHGDLLLQFCAHTPDTNIHALRDIVKNTPDLLVLRWKQEGTVPVIAASANKRPESARNLLGFRDGSANPDSSDAALMERIVWVGKENGEPAWATHGSYQAVRIIRNFVERWDRTPLQEQESIIGRHKPTGAPFDGKTEFDVPDYAADPEGKKTPLDAHIRLANDRTPEAQKHLILRRPFNYSNGVAPNGQLEMGLLFIAYQANLQEGFIAVQEKLNGEPLEEYIKPIGGGYFFALPGVPGKDDFLGRTLLNA